jgi:hypothetical protein
MNKRKLGKVFPLLQIVAKLTEGERQVLLCYLNYDGCDGIYECVHNALYNTTLPQSEKKNILTLLKKNKKRYRCLVNKNEKPLKKYKTLQKVGDGVGVILNTILPLLDNYLKKK